MDRHTVLDPLHDNEREARLCASGFQETDDIRMDQALENPRLAPQPIDEATASLGWGENLDRDIPIVVISVCSPR